jgi:hypothetical protein
MVAGVLSALTLVSLSICGMIVSVKEKKQLLGKVINQLRRIVITTLVHCCYDKSVCVGNYSDGIGNLF